MLLDNSLGFLAEFYLLGFCELKIVNSAKEHMVTEVGYFMSFCSYLVFASLIDFNHFSVGKFPSN